MYIANVDPPWDFEAWRTSARAAIMAEVEPDQIAWNADAQGDLLVGVDVSQLPPITQPPRVSAPFLSFANAVLCHRDGQRHGLLYRLLWRIAHGENRLLERVTDLDVHRALALQKSVLRDSHKMKAFVRFREIPGEADAFVAWFEPEHYIVDYVAPFFERRFAGMRWAILTPYRSAIWDGNALAFAAGSTRSDAPDDDSRESLWLTYYANIFNPARLNPQMMRSEMPQKYWKHLPEAALLPDLIRDAGLRVREMAEREPVAPRRRIPAPLVAPIAQTSAVESIALLRKAAASCQRCELYKPATRTVFGEGPEDARVVVIGEQPGDQEDLIGRPFVGPAGQLLDGALKEVGIDRSQLYLTNAVKHFRFEQRGKHRLHRSPARSHEHACQIWLEAEMAKIKPQWILALGATAARAVHGPNFSLTQQRGLWHRSTGGQEVFATVHPSWVLRQTRRDDAYQLFVDDLKRFSERISADKMDI